MEAARSIPRDGHLTDALTTDVILLAALIAAEARGEPYEGQVAVACVVRNRVERPRWWGDSWQSVILKPLQFEPFNIAATDGYGAYTKLLDLMHLIEPQHTYIASGVIARRLADNTHGATHFVNPRLATPDWMEHLVQCATIGAHRFYRED